ncbi:GIY-YIG nuclease family protein [Streptomyces asiaticus]
MFVHRSFENDELPEALLAAALDGRLTYAARGLLIELLTSGDKLEASAVAVGRRAKDARGDKGEGRDSVRGLLDELKECGYLLQHRFRANRGQLGTRTDLYDSPRKPSVALPPEYLASEGSVDEGAVYVIGQPGSSTVKIGSTSSLEGRLKGIQTGSPVRLEVLWSCQADWRLEAFLHGVFRDLRLEGEWFDFENADPVAEVARAAEQFRPSSA